MPTVEMAELVNETGHVVYVAIGLSGKAMGFFVKDGKPIPSNHLKHLKMTTTYHKG